MYANAASSFKANLRAAGQTAKRAPKLTFSEALERVNDGHSINAADVQTRALQRKLWISEWHIPGCISESQGYSLTKRDAIAEALEMCGHARGARADLIHYGRTDKVSPDAYVSMAITSIERVTLADIL